MLTQDAFTEHKQEYTIQHGVPVLDIYNNETLQYQDAGTITAMFTPITDEASIELYGEAVVSMFQAVIYDETAISSHDRVDFDGDTYEIVTIKKYPSYRLIHIRKVQ